MGQKAGGSDIYADEGVESGLLNTKRLTDPLVIVIILVTAGYLFFLPNQSRYDAGVLDTWYVAFWLLLILSKTGLFTLKHYSPKAIGDPIHTTTFGYGEKIGIYEVFPMGDIYAGGMHYRGHDGTVIVPQAAVIKLGRNVAWTTPLEKIEPMEIPVSIRAEVIARNFQAPFYRGYLTDIQMTKMPSVSALIDENKYANRLANERGKFIVERLGDYEKYTGFAARQSTLIRKGAGQKAKEFLAGETS